MKNIICKNGWKKVNPEKENGATDKFVHGIQIKEGSKVITEIEFPFEVWLTKKGVRFIKNGDEIYVGLDELEETREQVKQIIQTCGNGTFGTTLQRRTTGAIVVDTDPIQTVNLDPYMQPGDTLAGIYDVFAPQYVNEGSLPEDYTIDVDGNVEFNTEIPVEDEPYVITINFWVTV